VHYAGNSGSLREALPNTAQNLGIASIALFPLEPGQSVKVQLL